MNRSIIIAIDGPSASGKGTLSKLLAGRLGYEHLDTGKLYRAVGYFAIKQEIELSDETKMLEIARQIVPGKLDIPDLNKTNIGRLASQIATNPNIRECLLKIQREFVIGKKGVILDGRDIGTIVFPDANIKFFITAGLEERAKRRYKQLQNTGKNIIYDQVLTELKERDEKDSKRKAAPLLCATDAIIIDTTAVNIEQSLATILDEVKKRLS